VPARLAPHHLPHRPAELEVEERRDERLEEDEEPGDDEARGRAERARGVGVEAAGRRLQAGELADRDRRAEAGDQREQDGERERLLRERHRDVDRVRDGGARRHVRDRLEENLRQADRVLAQVVEGPGRNWCGFHSRLLGRSSPRAMLSD
jgi:hypothetical protein